MKNKIRERKNLLMNLDWFDENFWGFFSNENNVIKEFNKKRHKVSNDSLSPGSVSTDSRVSDIIDSFLIVVLFLVVIIFVELYYIYFQI